MNHFHKNYLDLGVWFRDTRKLILMIWGGSFLARAGCGGCVETASVFCFLPGWCRQPLDERYSKGSRYCWWLKSWTRCLIVLPQLFQGFIHLRCRISADSITIRDWGSPMDPVMVSPPCYGSVTLESTYSLQMNVNNCVVWLCLLGGGTTIIPKKSWNVCHVDFFLNMGPYTRGQCLNWSMGYHYPSDRSIFSTLSE